MKWKLILSALVLCGACRSRAPATTNVDIWKPVGAWSGRGDAQTGTFTSDTGGFRVRWETRNESPPGSGTFKVVFRSNDSGRPIIDAVDFHGVGRDTTEVAENVRWYYLTVESAHVDWSLTVEERLRGQTTQ